MTGSFRVGDWQVEPQLNLLQRGDHSVHLAPKVMDVLCTLAEHAGEVLGKERLIQAVWPETFVTDDVLAHAVCKLRKAFEDDPADPRFIRTIARRGYQLIAQIEFTEESAPSPLLNDENAERSPYPGLASFTEKDRAVFFGRETEALDLWEKIRSRRLLAVIGPSGAGKTSFLRAAVIPSRPESWTCAYATLGAQPPLGLVRALAPEMAGNSQAFDELLKGVGELGRSGNIQPLVSVVGQWRSGHGEALLVIDQFEELFTLNPLEVQIQTAALIEALVSDGQVHVVLSLRDDFLIRCSDHPPLSAVFELVTPLKALRHDGLRRALIEPARLRGYRFEDEALVEEILSSVEGVRGSLPLLAFAVSRLWERRDQRRRILTREAYLEIGGVEGALAQHAEATLERVGLERRGIAREIFRNLVTSQGTRAATDREELLSVFPDRSAAEEVLRLLIDARLLTTYELEGKEGGEGRHRVEVVHESMLRAWPRLVRWQAQDEEGAVLRDQLRQAAHLWQEKGRNPALLWTGTAYREFVLWQERYPGALTGVESDFARAMDQRAKRRTRLLRFATATALLLVTLIALVVAVSRRQAVDAARRSEASRVLALAQLRLQEDPTEALALAAASLEMMDTREARLMAVKALAEGPPVVEMKPDIPQARSPTFSPRGDRLAAASHIAEVGVWNDEGSLLARLPGHEASVGGTNMAQWAGDDLVVTGLQPGLGKRVFVWAFPQGRLLRTIELGYPSWWYVLPDRLLAQNFRSRPDGREDCELRSWRLPDGDAVKLGWVAWTGLGSTSSFRGDGNAWLHARGDSVFSRPLPLESGPEVLFSRHGDRVQLGNYQWPGHTWVRERNGRIRMWSFGESASTEVIDIPKPETAPPNIRPDRSGRWIWSKALHDSSVRLWQPGGLPGSRPLTLRRTGPWYGGLCDVHPSGKWLVSSTQSWARLTFWPLPSRQAFVVDGYNRLSRPVAFSTDSLWLATSWVDGGIRLWPLPENTVSEVRELDGPKTLWRGLTFDSLGRYLFATGIGGEAYLVPSDGGTARELQGFSRDVQLDACAFSHDGRLAASASGYGTGEKTLRIWEIETGKGQVFSVPEPEGPSKGADLGNRLGYEASIRDLHFESDSVLYSSGDGGIRRWDLASGTQETVWEAPHCYVRMSMSTQRRLACVVRWRYERLGGYGPVERVDLTTGESEVLEEFGDAWWGVHLEGDLLAVGNPDGLVRVGKIDGGEPHILAGHVGAATYVAISPDLKWVASTGEDNTLRLWPMPDLSKPPLHTLPHDELITRLESLTNLRAAPDPAAQSGWIIELGPFPGWKKVPTW